MLTPYLGAPLLAALFLLILAGLGAGAASRLVDGGGRALLLAPALGLALATSVLTTVAAITPLRLAGPISLAIGLAISLSMTRWRVVYGTASRAGVVRIALLVLTAIALALLPVLAHGTYGPVNLYFMDSWFFVAADKYLSQATLGEAVDGSTSLNPTFATVAAIQRAHSRLGVDALQASLFELTQTSKIAGQYPAQAAYVATVGLTTYGLARLGTELRTAASTAAAILAVCMPVTVELWVDPRPANLVAVILAPILLLFGAWGVLNHNLRDGVVAGIAMAGIVASYVEHIPTIALAGLGLSALGLGASRAKPRQYVRGVALTVTCAVSVALALSPPGWFRAYEYARTLGAGVGGPALPGLDAPAIAPLIAGTAHVYELTRIPLTAPLKATILFNVTVCALILSAIGIRRSTAKSSGLAGAVYGSLLVASAVLAFYFRYTGGCGDYCVQKALTLSGPPMAVTVVLGAVAAWRWSVSHRAAWRVALSAVLAVYGCFVLRALIGLERGATVVPMAVDQADFAIPDAIEDLPRGAPVLIEGAEAVGDIAVFFDVPAALELTRNRDHPLRYETSLGAALAGGSFPGEAFMGDYRYVLTRFPGLRHGDRRTIRVFGQYALQQRVDESDVTLIRTGGTRDPQDDGADAIPWLRGPVTLRAVGAEEGLRILIELLGPAAKSTQWSVAGASLQAPIEEKGRYLCLVVPPGAPVRDIVLTPFGVSFPRKSRDPTQAFERSPRALGIAGIDSAAISPTHCR